jgi:hypothetical protein
VTRGLVAAALLAVAAPASAEPLRLRGDALAQAQSPSGLVALQADGELEERVRAEALLWMGAGGLDDEATVDALVATVEAHDPRRRVAARLGRFVATLGALRPVHVDGAGARARLPGRVALEGFAGVPVVPAFGAAAWDWVAGGRASRLVGDSGSVGVGYLQRREEGRLAASELGVDGGVAPTERLDLGGRVALDAIHGGIAEAQVSAALRRGPLRTELYAGERSAQRLLPATSLFSVIGDTPSRRAGAAVRWRAAPRLDVRATVGARQAAGEVGADLTLRADLRLDDRGAGALGGELRRQDAPGGGWTGARGIARVPVSDALTVSAELELVVPDGDGAEMDTGVVWPWGLVAASWRRGPWEVAAAVEGRTSPTERYRLDVLARVGRTWGMP